MRRPDMEQKYIEREREGERRGKPYKTVHDLRIWNERFFSAEEREREKREREREKREMKFSKQFEAQLVPEWREAFVDYWQLKKDLEKVQEACKRPSQPSLSRTLLSPIFYLLTSSFDNGPHAMAHPIIQVHKKTAATNKGDTYQTELQEHLAAAEPAKVFFSRLDLQLNKVNQFYRAQEGKFLERGNSLQRQLDILLALRKELKKQRRCCGFSISSEKSIWDQDKEDDQFKNISSSDMSMKDHGKDMRMKIPLTTPKRTISFLFSLLEDLLSQYKNSTAEVNSMVTFNTGSLRRAEKMIRSAFIELYKGLNYLETYRNLNIAAFAKILKKFDKVSGEQVIEIYLKAVESSYFNSSSKAIKLMDEVEELFVKHFTGGERRIAMKYLKPNQRKDSFSLCFFTGLFTGIFISFLVGCCIMAHIEGKYSPRSSSSDVETAYPIFSLFSLMFLHLFLYGFTIFMLRKTTINYSFILDFGPDGGLKHSDIFLICSFSMSMVMMVMFTHLSLILKGYSPGQIQVISGLLLLMFLVLLLCPFNIFYRRSRYHFIKTLRCIVLSPLYKVEMFDFFLADQICSQVPMLRNLEYVTCYYITGSYKNQDYVFCNTTTRYRDLAYAVSFLPYYWRAMQCIRRWIDEGEASHLANLGKYVSSMIAAGAKVTYEKKGMAWFSLFIITSSFATVYQLYWDFVKDWGLLQLNSKNPWLRNDLMLKRKSVYYISMGLNLTLRLAWLQSILHFNITGLDYRVAAFVSAALEVVRRGLWNFFRLENEHLNNVGKFRAGKTVPLPFFEFNEN
ncbi:EXS (ERD1/XPR1/SYG1) family protein [Wolffia australiana]